MTDPKKEGPVLSETAVLGVEDGRSYWQPVPANGYVSVRVEPKLVQMARPFAVGTQTVAAGCFVREHSHPDNDEVIHFLSGRGTLKIDGVEYGVEPGMTAFVGKNHSHMFVADRHSELQFLWIMVPSGLEDFFAAIGRPKLAGEMPPAPFPRPDDVEAIERRTVFGAPPARS